MAKFVQITSTMDTVTDPRGGDYAQLVLHALDDWGNVWKYEEKSKCWVMLRMAHDGECG